MDAGQRTEATKDHEKWARDRWRLAKDRWWLAKDRDCKTMGKRQSKNEGEGGEEHIGRKQGVKGKRKKTHTKENYKITTTKIRK